MKTSIFSALLFTFAFAFTAAAAPPLLVKTTVTGLHDKDVLSVPSITVESGVEALIEVNGIKYAVTPTLLDGGRVALRAVVTRRDAKDRNSLAVPLVTTELGKAAEIQIGRIVFATSCTLLK